MKKDIIEHFYERCKLIRRVEEEIEKLYPSDKIKSPVHLSIGQECVSVAACSALDKKDIVFRKVLMKKIISISKVLTHILKKVI